MTPTRYWVHGTLYFSKEDCQRECKSIHPRLGMSEAPCEVVLASSYDALAKLVEGLPNYEGMDILSENDTFCFYVCIRTCTGKLIHTFECENQKEANALAALLKYRQEMP